MPGKSEKEKNSCWKQYFCCCFFNDKSPEKLVASKTTTPASSLASVSSISQSHSRQESDPERLSNLFCPENTEALPSESAAPAQIVPQF